MKNLLTLSATLFTLNAMAYVNTEALITSRQTIKPTMYNCVGEQNTRIHFTTTSIAGVPTFSTVFKGLPISFNHQSEIRQDRTMIGKVVGATFNNPRIPDAPTRFYGVIIPEITLKSTQDHVVFNTQAIQSTLTATGYVAHPFYGAAQNNIFVPVKCTAEFVVF